MDGFICYRESLRCRLSCQSLSVVCLITAVASGCLLSHLPRPSILSLLHLSVGDPVASVVGVRFGARNRLLPSGKSLAVRKYSCSFAGRRARGCVCVRRVGQSSLYEASCVEAVRFWWYIEGQLSTANHAMTLACFHQASQGRRRLDTFGGLIYSNPNPSCADRAL